MEQVLQFIADYQWWMYGLFGLLILFYLWRALSARRETARAMFPLEREQAQTRYGRSVALMAGFLVLVAAVFGLTTFGLPALNRPVEAATPTVTMGPLPAPTLTSTPPPPTITPTASATTVRPTRPVQSSETPAALVATPTPVVRPPTCPNPGVRIVSPGVNQVVQGNFAVRGSASIADFSYYKIEVGPGLNPGDNAWTVVGNLHDAPVNSGVLATFNSGSYAPGIYTLRLVVVDATGNFPEPCRVTINVQR